MDTLYSTGGTSYKIDPCQSKFFDPSLVVPEHQEPYKVKHMSDAEKAAFIASVCESRGSYIDPVKAQATAELLGSIYSPKKEESTDESQEETSETSGTKETEQNTDSEDNEQEKSEEQSTQDKSETGDSSTGKVTDEEQTSATPAE